MDSWQKESLNLKVGDWIVWQDEAIELEGQPTPILFFGLALLPFFLFAIMADKHEYMLGLKAP